MYVHCFDLKNACNDPVLKIIDDSGRNCKIMCHIIRGLVQRRSKQIFITKLDFIGKLLRCVRFVVPEVVTYSSIIIIFLKGVFSKYTLAIGG